MEKKDNSEIIKYLLENYDIKNAIESLNRSYRKYTKTKGVFPNDVSLMKCLYLATQNIESKWTVRYGNWDMIYAELDILYPERLHWSLKF